LKETKENLEKEYLLAYVKGKCQPYKHSIDYGDKRKTKRLKDEGRYNKLM
jgi:hypothetical protein